MTHTHVAAFHTVHKQALDAVDQRRGDLWLPQPGRGPAVKYLQLGVRDECLD